MHSFLLFPSLFSNDPSTTQTYTLSLHDALPISFANAAEPSRTTPPRPKSGSSCPSSRNRATNPKPRTTRRPSESRSEEHTSELQSPCNLVCRLLLEKKNQYV